MSDANIDEAVRLCASLISDEKQRARNQEIEDRRCETVFTKDDTAQFGLILTENGLDAIAEKAEEHGIIVPDNPDICIIAGSCHTSDEGTEIPFNQVLGHSENIVADGLYAIGTDLYVAIDPDSIRDIKEYGFYDPEENPFLVIHNIEAEGDADIEGIVFPFEMKTAVFSEDNAVSYRVEGNDRKNDTPAKIESDALTVNPDYNLEHYKPSDDAVRVIENIKDAGGEAFLVGGGVRDAMLGLESHDEDITTNLTPAQVTELFENMRDAFVVPTGIEHGTVTVFFHEDDGISNGFEVTTYRIDGESSDQRHPDSVSFTSDINEDLQRRDFTMNAIAYDPVSHTIVDPFDGRTDMQNGIIRSVGDPNQRIEEDALRMMRGIRFSVQKDMDLSDDLKTAVTDHAGDIENISKERINHELVGILMSDHPGNGMSRLHETGLLREILPMLDREYDTAQNHPWHIYNVGEHTAKVLDHTPKDEAVRLAALFHDIGKPDVKTTDENGIDHFYGHAQVSAKMAESCMRELRFPNDVIRDVKSLVANHEDRMEPNEKSVRTFIEKHPGFDNEKLHQLLELQTADKLGQNPEKNPDAVENHVEIDKIIDSVTENPYRVQDLALNGRDIMNIQETRKGDTVVLSGRDVQLAKEKMLSYVISNPEKNNPSDLTKYLQDNLKSIKYESIEHKFNPDTEKERYDDRKEFNEVKKEIIRLNPEQLEYEKAEYLKSGEVGSTLEKALDLYEKYGEKLERIKKADSEKEPALSDKEKIEAEKEKKYRDDVEEKYDDWHDPVD